MISPGDIVKKVEIYFSDNCGDDTGREGMDIHITFQNGKGVVEEGKWISELEDQPYGIYIYDGNDYKQVENHE